MHTRLLPWLLAAVALLPLASGGAAPERAAPGISLRLDHPEVLITSRFRGDMIRVSGQAPEGADVVLKLSSEVSAETLDLKAKRGVLWLSVGKVRFENVPRLYLIRSNRPMEQLLSPAQQSRQGLGLVALRASIGVQQRADADLFVSELLRLKRDRGLYDWEGGGLTREAGGGYHAQFPWPAQGPPGKYRLEAFAVSGGEIAGTAAETVVVRKVGMEERVSRLAADHGLIYGLLSAALAIVTGLAMNALVAALGRLRRKGPAAGAGCK
jgi:uncharacterized protein (TIGR02186 family)